MSSGDNLIASRRQLRLFRAAQAGDVPLVGQLFAEGFDVDGRNSAGLSALHFAAAGGQEQVVKELLRHGADVNAASHTGLFPLMIAARDGHVEIVRLLLRAGADSQATVAAVPEARDHSGRSALSLASDSRVIALYGTGRGGLSACGCPRPFRAGVKEHHADGYAIH